MHDPHVPLTSSQTFSRCLDEMYLPLLVVAYGRSFDRETYSYGGRTSLRNVRGVSLKRRLEDETCTHTIINNGT